MNVTVIPFLLLAEIASNNEWQYGPQINMSLKINSSFTHNNQENDVAVLTANVLCQPKEEIYLNCKVVNGNITTIEIDKDTNERKEESEDSFTDIDLQFMLAFNRKGIDHVLLQKHQFHHLNEHLVILRHIVSLLNIGIDLKGKDEDATFNEIEDYQTSQCKVTIQMIRAMKPVRMLDEREFALKLIPFQQEKDEILHLYKNRELSGCSNYLGEFYNIAAHIDTMEHVQEAMNNLFITDREFESFSYSTLSGATRKMNQFNLIDKAHLKLQSITPATESFEPIENAVETSILLIPSKPLSENE